MSPPETLSTCSSGYTSRSCYSSSTSYSSSTNNSSQRKRCYILEHSQYILSCHTHQTSHTITEPSTSHQCNTNRGGLSRSHLSIQRRSNLSALGNASCSDRFGSRTPLRHKIHSCDAYDVSSSSFSCEEGWGYYVDTPSG